ncbi:very short patch repair endonuclease [Hoylesella marshii]|uniref:Very short patch repair endonuclease n=1 Tax=Hoylesella marshii DSM 16973 = JCM 13450 TaxID=862515 RepID=E0NU13_9BACT|nr:very short patch repair endonuclease [Hoylesella marshii]EFM01546.1 DNA mismatch endonuclease Vsr [Hoylesella marshii DSM 16973 = JCM 13450]
MADTVGKEKRSEIMSHVTGKETKPEKIVRKYLFAQGLRYRKNVKRLPGTPDIVLQKYKAVIFVNGCFWHGHQGCKYAHLPSTNLEYWEKKIADNLERDKRKTQELERLGYRVSVVWQCQLKPKVREQNLRNLYNNIVEHT